MNASTAVDFAAPFPVQVLTGIDPLAPHCGPCDVHSVSPWEAASGTDRLLPDEQSVPEIFFDRTNPHNQLARALQSGKPCNKVLAIPIDPYGKTYTKAAIRRCAIAHLKAPHRDPEILIASVAFMLSQFITVIVRPDQPPEKLGVRILV